MRRVVTIPGRACVLLFITGERRRPVTESKDAQNWADPIEAFHVGKVPEGAGTGNVEGRRPVGPLQGFGQLWQKTYEVSVPGTTPEELIATWKELFAEFWPSSNRFYAPAAGIQPGEIAIIGGQAGPIKVSTGVRVIYADERSWAYMMPEGHPFSAIITFSAHEDEDAVTVARVDAMLRASDPIFELGFRIFISRQEDKIWAYTLARLAEHLGVGDPHVIKNVVLVDRRRQWNEFGNIWKNSVIGTLLGRDRRR